MGRKAINGIKYWAQLFLLPVYWLSFLIPRSRHIWLFGSTFGRRFADNPRYLYLYSSRHVKEISFEEGGSRRRRNIRPIWISRSRDIVRFLEENGYEAYYYHSLKGIWYCLRGKVYLFDNYSKDISFWLSGGAVKVNLWHGVGNKCINYDNIHDKVRHPRNAWERFLYFPRRLSDEKPNHYILTTSPAISRIFSRAFRIPKSHVIEAGYPRNDILFPGSGVVNLYTKCEQEALDRVREWKNNGGRVLAYIPTFRPSENRFLQIMDMGIFQQFLEKNQMLMLCKLHPKSSYKQEFEKMKYKNIYHISADADINAILGDVDLLITDYSSVYSDYMLLDRPVVAFQYDYEEYKSDTRDAYFPFDKYMPEQRAVNLEELLSCILKAFENDTASERRKRSRAVLFSRIDGNACRRLTLEIKDILKNR